MKGATSRGGADREEDRGGADCQGQVKGRGHFREGRRKGQGPGFIALDLNADIKEHLNTYVESTMRRISPNVGLVAGETIRARLMARAGGLDRLAMLPASTIQILGAEKALFRALKTGARPPKHGILFQHQDVHTAPKWQRENSEDNREQAGHRRAGGLLPRNYGGDAEARPRQGIEQIRAKYKDPPPRKPERKQKRRR